MAKSKSKPKSKKPKKSAAEKIAIDVQAAAQNATDPAYALSLIKAFEGWVTVDEFAAKERKRTKELVDGRLAAFKESMEVGHNTTNDQVLKLSLCETRWQELEEAREERKLINGSCKDQIKVAKQKIVDLLNPQLGLFNGPPNTDPATYESGSTIDNPPQPEEDEPEDIDPLPDDSDDDD